MGEGLLYVAMFIILHIILRVYSGLFGCVGLNMVVGYEKTSY